MKILVTGGAGFIGSWVADAFTKEGHKVLVVDDLCTGIEGNIPKKAAPSLCIVATHDRDVGKTANGRTPRAQNVGERGLRRPSILKSVHAALA